MGTERTYSLEILPPAQRELEEIAELWLSLGGKEAARKITDQIYDALERLTSFPLSGPAMREWDLRAMGYRYVLADRYIAVYRVIDHTVVVSHIADYRQDYPTLFRSKYFQM